MLELNTELIWLAWATVRSGGSGAAAASGTCAPCQKQKNLTPTRITM